MSELRSKLKASSLLEEGQRQIIQDVNRILEVEAWYQQHKEENKELEASKYEEFIRSVEDKTWFHISHVDNLNLPYTALIFLTSKNSGKTHEQYRLISECIARGEKFFYLRSLKSETDQLIYQFQSDAACPVVVVRSYGRLFAFSKADLNYVISQYQLAKNVETVPEPSWQLFNKYGCKPVGYLIDFRKCNSVGGASYDGVSCIIYDECLSHDPNQLVNSVHCAIFQKFISSVQRNKPTLKVLCFGNMTSNNALLSFYGISTVDKLRYIPFKAIDGEEINGNLLYINCGGVYGGSFKNQQGLAQFGDPRTLLEQRENKIIKDDLRILADLFWDQADHQGAYICEKWFIEWREIPAKKCENGKKLVGCRVRLLQTLIFPRYPCIYVDSREYLKNENCWYVRNIGKKLRFIFKEHRLNSLYYYDNLSLKVITGLNIKYYEQNYI